MICLGCWLIWLTCGEDDDEPDWVVEHVKAQKRKEALQKQNEFRAHLARIKAEEEEKKKKKTFNGFPPAKRTVGS